MQQGRVPPAARAASSPSRNALLLLAAALALAAAAPARAQEGGPIERIALEEAPLVAPPATSDAREEYPESDGPLPSDEVDNSRTARAERRRRADVRARREGRREPASPEQWGKGPFDVRNEHVFSQMHLSLGPDSPGTLEWGDLSLFARGALAQTLDEEPSERYVLDAETVQATLTLRAAVLPRIELSVEVPFIWRWEGVFDPVATAVERGTGNLRGPRKRRPENVYLVGGLTDDGRRFDYPEAFGVGKLRTGLKCRVLDGGPWPALSIEALAAWPTSSDGFGAHGVDAGLRMALSRRFGRVILYAGGTGVLPARDLGPIEAVPFQYGAFAAVELEIETWLSAIYQGDVMSPEWKNLRGEGGLIILHGGGLKGRFGRFSVELAIIENGGDVKRSQDASLHFGVGVTF